MAQRTAAKVSGRPAQQGGRRGRASVPPTCVPSVLLPGLVPPRVPPSLPPSSIPRRDCGRGLVTRKSSVTKNGADTGRLDFPSWPSTQGAQNGPDSTEALPAGQAQGARSAPAQARNVAKDLEVSAVAFRTVGPD